MPRCRFTIKTCSVKHWCHCIVTLDPDSHQAIESIMQFMCFVLSIYCPRTSSSVDVVPTAFRTQPRFDANSAHSHPTPPNLRPSFHTDELSTEHIFIFKKKKTSSIHKFKNCTSKTSISTGEISVRGHTFPATLRPRRIIV